VQNGATIPEHLPAIPLGQNAKLYIEQKAGRGADTLTALPNISRHPSGGVGALGSSGGMVSQHDGGHGGGKLQKRSLPSGRIGGRVG